MESGLRPAAIQLENRRRRFEQRLLSLPKGDQAREAVGVASVIGKWLESARGYSGRMENTILLEDPEAFDAVELVEARLRPGRRRSAPSQVSPSSRTGRESTAGRWDTRSRVEWAALGDWI